ncbi:MAG: biotin/lipoyl-binding protein [Deltaproteobacteria bacterium]|nr:MAG: biotin/lipoyl-binding protein [Deltaproteobacteria bacterium]
MRRLLVANRGEIALRIMKTARRLGIETVAVYSEPDRESPHVKFADTAVALGGKTPLDSYLRVEKIVEAAKRTECDSIHPGYGFLAENPDLPRACEREGIVFVGPSADVMERLGDKRFARSLARKAGIPLVPGYEGEDRSPERFRVEAAKIGYPVMLKSLSGGGGRGIRVVSGEGELFEALRSAAEEAESAFGRGDILVEKYYPGARHVEVQVLADEMGHVTILGERECSAQRRFQKVVEEAPAPFLGEETREELFLFARHLVTEARYVGAGTVEFLLTGDGPFFLEVNTRIQVEHPVTEMVTGVDIVEWQIRIARGESIEVLGSVVSPKGHALEARIYAEDPSRGFMPQSGKVHLLRLPEGEGIRVDHALSEGGSVSSYYDPLLGKVVARGGTREEALDRLRMALKKTAILGVRTNVPFLVALIEDPDFVSGRYGTDLIENFTRRWEGKKRGRRTLPFIVPLIYQGESFLRSSLPRAFFNWSSTAPLAREERFSIDGEEVTVTVQPLSEGRCRVRWGSDSLVVGVEREGEGVYRYCIDGKEGCVFSALLDGDLFLSLEGEDFLVHDLTYREGGRRRERPEGEVLSPIDGRVLEVRAEEGMKVNEGDLLLTVESMKMENRICSPVSGIVKVVRVTGGAQVREGDLLVEIEAEGVAKKA